MKKAMTFLLGIILLVGCTKHEVDSVKIGTQTWTTKNLDVTTYNDGTVIPEVTDQTQWSGLTTGAWCHYNNDPANDVIYGKLYIWFAVNDPRGLAPQGFHIPSDEEWATLIDYLGGLESGGGKMKEIGTAHWKIPNTGATNTSGFTALSGGYRTSLGRFTEPGTSGFWWSTSENDETGYSWSFALGYFDSGSAISDYDKAYGFSIRCVKN